LLDRLADFLVRVTPSGQILFISNGSPQWLGYPEGSALKGTDLWPLVVQDDHEALKTALSQAVDQGRQVLRIRLIRGDGEVLPVTCRALPLIPGKSTSPVLVAAWDIGARHGSDPVSATHQGLDPVTNLPTRRLLLEKLEEMTQAEVIGDEGFSLMHLDLDGFQKVNDALGQVAGDQLLKEAAGRLSALVRASDFVARSGSDEFCLILSGTHDEGATIQVARKVLTAMQRPYQLGGRNLRLTASIGIALYPEHASEGEQLFKCADIALTTAKAGGRNRWQFYRQGGVAEANKRFALEEHLYDAIQNGEFEMVYQPIFRTSDRDVWSLEALMRWNRPGEGAISPVEFIPVAERNGLIGLLGAWSLRVSCHQVARWNKAWGVSMGISVNLSPAQFRQGDIVATVQDALAESQLPPDLLTLEITEGTLMQDPVETQELLNRLRDLGVGVSVDDFGTGYSSLAYLKRFPLSSFKIDRSFVSELERGGNDLAIVSVILGLARDLGLKVVAEGVETEEQLVLLKDKGCDLVQGYLLGRPAAATELENKVESGEWKVMT